MTEHQPAITIKKIQTLNQHERSAIEEALQYWIKNHTERESWSQTVILEEMLPLMMWGSL